MTLTVSEKSDPIPTLLLPNLEKFTSKNTSQKAFRFAIFTPKPPDHRDSDGAAKKDTTSKKKKPRHIREPDESGMKYGSVLEEAVPAERHWGVLTINFLRYIRYFGGDHFLGKPCERLVINLMVRCGTRFLLFYCCCVWGMEICFVCWLYFVCIVFCINSHYSGCVLNNCVFRLGVRQKRNK